MAIQWSIDSITGFFFEKYESSFRECFQQGGFVVENKAKAFGTPLQTKGEQLASKSKFVLVFGIGKDMLYLGHVREYKIGHIQKGSGEVQEGFNYAKV